MRGKKNFIDLFAGIGGIRLGFENNGFECVFSSENNEACIKMYEENFREKPYGDITQLNINEVPEHDILCAGFPCQAFSIAGKRKGFEETRGTLFFDVLRIINHKKPKVIFLENVKNLKYHDGGKTLKIILNKLEKEGYTVDYKIYNAKDFGVPQNRERTVIIATQNKNFNFNKVEHSKHKKIKDILDKGGEYQYLGKNEYTLISKHHIKKQKSGLIFVGYKNKSTRKKGVRPNTNHLSRVHKQCNRIYSSEGVHPTLSSSEISGRYYVYHKGKVRKLSIAECFKLQGFPKNFKKNCSKVELYKQIGNSVTVPMVEAIAKEIKNQLF